MIHNYKLFISLSICIIISISSCSLFNPGDPVPAYIHIDKISLTVNSDGSQGTKSSKISDAWVYIDEQLIGCFELPATFPVLYEGSHEIKIRPGIKVNGISATRAPYPFYTIYDTVLNLQKGAKTYLNPIVKYRTNMTFSFMESFEGAGTIIAKSPTIGVDTVLQVIHHPNPNVFEGSSGIAYLDATHHFFECVSATSYQLPQSSADVFLEFNYKCNHIFTVGVFAHTSSGSTTQSEALTLNPSASWNKTYIYLTPVVSGNYTATDFNIFFGMVNTGSDSIAMLLDNIKLVY
jgi:hypothetical protein